MWHFGRRLAVPKLVFVSKIHQKRQQTFFRRLYIGHRNRIYMSSASWYSRQTISVGLDEWNTLPLRTCFHNLHPDWLNVLFLRHIPDVSLVISNWIRCISSDWITSSDKGVKRTRTFDQIKIFSPHFQRRTLTTFSTSVNKIISFNHVCRNTACITLKGERELKRLHFLWKKLEWHSG